MITNAITDFIKRSTWLSTLTQKLKARKQQNEEYILTRSEALGPLDYEISEQEMVTAIDLLKTGKAPVVNNILCELLKHGKEALKRASHNPFQ